MAGNIQNPDYETVTAVCEHCGSQCVFNRIDDIGEPGPYDGRYVTCCVCQKSFWIHGDIINPAYELLISSARERFETKRYMQCVGLLAQAWELLFSLYAYSNYLYGPWFASSEPVRRSERFKQLSEQLYNATRKFPFFPLRNLLINTVLKGVHPQALTGSAAAISRIVDDNFGKDPKKADVENFPDKKISELLQQLLELKIGELRNEVVHHHAYRPRRAEVDVCLKEEIELLYDVRDALPVYTFEYWRFKTKTGASGNLPRI